MAFGAILHIYCHAHATFSQETTGPYHPFGQIQFLGILSSCPCGDDFGKSRSSRALFRHASYCLGILELHVHIRDLRHDVAHSVSHRTILRLPPKWRACPQASQKQRIRSSDNNFATFFAKNLHYIETSNNHNRMMFSHVPPLGIIGRTLSAAVV